MARKRHAKPSPAVRPRLPSAPLAAGLFLATAFLIFWQVIDVSLLYHGGGYIQGFPSFYWDGRFARETLRHPGGPVDYPAALLMQSAWDPRLGALLLAGQCTLLFLALRDCLQRLDSRVPGILAALPTLCVLGIYGNYQHSSAFVTAVVLSIGLAWAWLRFRLERAGARLAALVGLTLLVAIASPKGLLPFGAVLFGIELSRPKARASLLTLPGALGLGFLSASLIYGYSAREYLALLFPTAMETETVAGRVGPFVWALLFLPAALVLATAIIARRRASQPSHTRVEARELQRVQAVSWVVVLGALAAILGFAHDRPLKTVIAGDRLAWNQKWPELLRYAKDEAGSNPHLGCAVAQAMFHTGQFPQELPPLRSGQDLLLANDNKIGQWRRSQLCLELGFLNKGLHHLTECVEYYGERPLLLRRLAHVNLALGNVPTARIYLLTLAKAPFQRDWARDQLALLEAGREDPEVARLRQSNLASNSVVVAEIDEELLDLLRANRTNRMAFEYLITHSLVTRDLKGFVQNIGRVRDFPELAPGPLWQEALVLANALANPKPDPGLMASCGAAQGRLEKFVDATRSMGPDKKLAAEKLRAEYGQSYFFYYLLGG